MIGASPALVRLRANLDRLSRRSRAPVLIVGEPGTGRSHCARSLHAATYPDGELFSLASEGQLEELERRVAALSIRSSCSGTAGLTVYVHELPETSVKLQLALHKLLKERGLELRVIASSREALGHGFRGGLASSELVSSFSAVLELAPLRDRIADLPALSRHFAQIIAERSGLPAMQFTREALERLEEHAWPGNLSELKQVIEQLSHRVDRGPVDLADLPELGERESGLFFVLPPNGIDFAELERLVLSQALTMAQNNQTRAASLLGLTRDQIRYRLTKFEIAGAGRHGG
ncbi:MAG TPA: helix-turn-helix domain-containing protein [Polyangiaceae bacterium]|nr:helix-turn-helix domain-containing protein [Polyangiaceae bacterium]